MEGEGEVMRDIQPREKTKRKGKKKTCKRWKGEGVKLINVETNETWVHTPEKSHLFPFRRPAL